MGHDGRGEHGDGTPADAGGSGAEAERHAEFRAFYERHHAELVRLAARLLADGSEGEDLAADAFAALWHRWDRVRAARHPAAYARGVVAHLARSRIRAGARERRRVALFWAGGPQYAEDADVPSVLDVRAALARLPRGRRACVVLRHAFGLSERDTASALGVSVGTVKSQTSRSVAELGRLLGRPGPDPERGRDTGGSAPGPARRADAELPEGCDYVKQRFRIR
ncbi:SigE family RNA polymerase sigma factor [Streptomyces sp. TRM 70351]|uniref:SigE family RNA polymerase sigma factor n=1 Tax=Streptomyces sp. TRM 70351 TaxID=3116552 RepID=UPI002E7B01FE|nr:SigE family RNA polymerase sigma factor [Streptomyces sp. TRM 70351]MEE1930597.1 SigE family RNA polymerase sigma factor [Streptomyces sp. TRM 70351]